MKAQGETVEVIHRENGLKSVFSTQQWELMGKANRRMFKQASPSEADDLEKKTQETLIERLTRENEELRKIQVQAALISTAPVTETIVEKTPEQLQAEGLRVENNRLRAQVTAATSTLESEPVDSEESDPNPELTALRAQYEEVVGQKPGRLGIAKLTEAIAEANKVEPK